MSQPTPRHRKATKSDLQTKDVALCALILITAILLNSLLFYGLLYEDKGSFRVEKNPHLNGVTSGELPPATSETTSAQTSQAPETSENSGADITSSTTSGSSDLSQYTYEAQCFQSDLSSYETYMNPQGNDYLILVNTDNPLTADDIPDDLIDVINTRTDRSAEKMRLYAAKALEALFIEAKQAGMLYDNGGYILSVTSAYRSYARQKSIFENYVQETMSENPSLSRAEAEAQVMTYSCRPGTSEHQSGLCADLHNFSYASVSNGMREKFAASKAGQWLLENCHKFGFVLRFPEDKTDVTGISYESWHFRYVGRYHATQMTEMGLCLEEYVAWIKNS